MKMSLKKYREQTRLKVHHKEFDAPKVALSGKVLGQATPPPEEVIIPAACTTRPIATPGETAPETLPALKPDAVTAPVPSAESALKARRQKMTGRHLPILHCNICPHADLCPAAKPGYECAFSNSFLKDVSTPADLHRLMKHVVESSLMRAQQAVLFEQLSGVTGKEETTVLLETAFEQLKSLHEIEREGRAPADTPAEGILGALFGNLAKKYAPKPAINITADIQEAEEAKPAPKPADPEHTEQD